MLKCKSGVFPLSLILLYQVVSIVSASSSDVDFLTRNFFDNLQAFPELFEMKESELNNETKRFIDSQVDNFVTLITASENEDNGVKAGKAKRSLLEEVTVDPTGVHGLKDISSKSTIPAVFPEDIELFQQGHLWYAAALDRSGGQSLVDSLVIYRYSESEPLQEITRTQIENGTKLATSAFAGSTLIVVARNSEFSQVLVFQKDSLTKIQTLPPASGVELWKMHAEIFLALPRLADSSSENGTYELPVSVYRWRGGHFDREEGIQIEGRGVEKVAAFNVGPSNFLAVANSRNDRGDTKIYSEIYKFDYENDRFEVHQRIMTSSCSDLAFFTLTSEDGRERDHFMVVANNDDEDPQIVYKLVEGYFIPFQTLAIHNVRKWLPIQGSNGQFVLLGVTTFDGLKVFQYDGWTFSAPTPYPDLNIFESLRDSSGIMSMRAASINGSSRLVVTNRNTNGKQPNVFGLNFEQKNSLRDLHDEMLGWCEESGKRLEKLATDTILGIPARGDMDEEGNQEDDSRPQRSEAKKETLQSKLDSISSILDDLEITMESSMQSSQPKRIKHPQLQADEIVFNDRVIFENLQTEKLNRFKVDALMNETFSIDTGFEVEDPFSLNSIRIFGNTSIGTINNRSSSDLVHTSDNLTLSSFVVLNGTVTCLSGLNTTNGINGVRFDENLLQVHTKQVFSVPVVLNKVTVTDLRTKNLNQANPQDIQRVETRQTNSLKNLTVKNLGVAGYINNVEIQVLDQFCLKLSGDQEILAPITVDKLKASSLKASNWIGDTPVDAFIDIEQGHYDMNEAFFESTMFVNDLEVLNNLNLIPVDQGTGKLELLLKDKPEEQTLLNKTFENLETRNPILLRNKIKSKVMEQIRPVVLDDSDLTMDASKTMHGNLTVELLLSATDIIAVSDSNSDSDSDSTAELSLLRLQNDGVRLDDVTIQPRLNFAQQLSVEDISVEAINGVPISSLVVTGTGVAQNITGPKTFTADDLAISGGSTALRINMVDFEELQKELLFTSGDQQFAGSVSLDHVIAESISSNNTRVNTKPWSQIAPRQNSSETLQENATLHGDVSADFVEVSSNVVLKGTLNSLDFDAIVADTVLKTNVSIHMDKIRGTKVFKSLRIEEILSENGLWSVGPSTPFDSEEGPQLMLEGHIRFRFPTSVRNLSFIGHLNNASSEDFGKVILDEEGRFELNQTEFKRVKVYGRTFVEAGGINGVEVEKLEKETVKVDEPFEFEFGTFETLITKTDLRVEGQIENFDFDNIVLSDSDLVQEVFDSKIFRSNVSVDGNVTFDSGAIGGLNLNQLCRVANAETEVTPNLRVKGNAYFGKGPDVQHINNVSVQEIWDHAWFSDRDTVLTGRIEFGDVHFKDDVFVEGYIDNVSLPLLMENYVSKSRPQNITALLTVVGTATFQSNVSTPEIYSPTGLVNGRVLPQYANTILVQDYDQVFETTPFLESCHIKDLQGSCTVNNMNLEMDVMRYDKQNVVIGSKIIQSVRADSLQLPANKVVKVQDVDVLTWLREAVLKSGTFNVTGAKQFGNVAMDTVYARLLNGRRFDNSTVLLRSEPQEISGTKTFTSESALDPVVFKEVKLRGKLNSVDVWDLINNEAYKDKDNTLDAPINFHNAISAENLVIKKTFNGINVSELITNVTSLGALNDLRASYEKLLNMSKILNASLEAQAYFVHHFEVVQEIRVSPSMSKSMIKFTRADGVSLLGLWSKKESYCVLDMYEWDPTGTLVEASSTKYPSLTYMSEVFMGRYLYTEDETGTGKLFNLASPEDNPAIMRSNATRSTTSFAMPTSQKACTLFIYVQGLPRILCEGSEELELIQELQMLGALESAVLKIEDTLYLAAISGVANAYEARTTLWRFDSGTETFHAVQEIFEASPKSLAMTSVRGKHFLAVASGRVENAMFSGRVEVRVFQQGRFAPFQTLELDAPEQVEFAVLPTRELLMYVMTANPTQPLIVYRYEGIAGFRRLATAATLGQSRSMLTFNVGVHQHLVVAQHFDDRLTIVKAVFKGEKCADEM